MLDGTLNIILEDSSLPLAFSNLEKQSRTVVLLYPEQFTSLLSNSEISTLVERIKASQSLAAEIPAIFTQFAHWMARLQTNNALARDFDELIEVESLLTISSSGTSHHTADDQQYTYSKDLLLNYTGTTLDPARIGDAIVGIATEDSLLYDS